MNQISQYALTRRIIEQNRERIAEAVRWLQSHVPVINVLNRRQYDIHYGLPKFSCLILRPVGFGVTGMLIKAATDSTLVVLSSKSEMGYWKERGCKGMLTHVAALHRFDLNPAFDTVLLIGCPTMGTKAHKKLKTLVTGCTVIACMPPSVGPQLPVLQDVFRESTRRVLV